LRDSIYDELSYSNDKRDAWYERNSVLELDIMSDFIDKESMELLTTYANSIIHLRGLVAALWSQGEIPASIVNDVVNGTRDSIIARWYKAVHDPQKWIDLYPIKVKDGDPYVNDIVKGK